MNNQDNRIDRLHADDLIEHATSQPHILDDAEAVCDRAPSDARLEQAMNDPECRAAISLLVGKGYRPGTVADTMNTMELLDLPDDARVQRLCSVGVVVATGENLVRWVQAYGHIWCVRSTTQCDYCGPHCRWTLPKHARATRSRLDPLAFAPPTLGDPIGGP
jgi:hypothetical protein